MSIHVIVPILINRKVFNYSDQTLAVMISDQLETEVTVYDVNQIMNFPERKKQYHQIARAMSLQFGLKTEHIADLLNRPVSTVQRYLRTTPEKPYHNAYINELLQDGNKRIRFWRDNALTYGGMTRKEYHKHYRNKPIVAEEDDNSEANS